MYEVTAKLLRIRDVSSDVQLSSTGASVGSHQVQVGTRPAGLQQLVHCDREAH